MGLAELQARLALLPGSIASGMLDQAQTLSDALADRVRDKLSGDVLNVGTGALRDSISSEVEQGNGAQASVYVDGNLPYAAIQEYGGVTKGYIIEAVNAKALAFKWQGKQAFFKRVMHPGSVIPARSYLRSSLADMTGDIIQGFTDALNEVLNP